MAQYLRTRPLGRGINVLKTTLWALLLLPLAALLVAFLLLFELEAPTLTLGKEPRFLGDKVELPLQLYDKKSGIRSLNIQLVQGDKTVQVYDKEFPRKAWFSMAGPESLKETVLIDTQKAGLVEGPAQLVIQAQDFSINNFFSGNLTEKVLPVTIDIKPPQMTVLYAQRLIRPGTVGVATYSLSEPSPHHGLLIDDLFFAGFPTGKQDTYIVYFALPWDAQPFKNANIIAFDEAGNEGRAPCNTSFRKAEEKRDSIAISDTFLQRKIPEFEQHYPQLRGTMVEKYVQVNNEIRMDNDKIIREVCAQSDPQQLWSDRFLRMPGAGRARFADQRTYTYQGAVIDHQTHLGVDIASTEQAEVRAANRGRIIFADYLGIYGNLIIIDHGQGVSTLYSHLSRIETTKGIMVEKNTPIGRTGTTGMAGGDHLHFSILIHGIFVSPIEWWDQHWVDVNIKAALNGQ